MDYEKVLISYSYPKIVGCGVEQFGLRNAELEPTLLRCRGRIVAISDSLFFI